MTKSGKPRSIHLSEDALTVLAELGSRGQSAFLFPSQRTGQPFNNIYDSWNKARLTASLAGFRMHDLRHSFASFLVNNGVEIYEVMTLLGHSNVKTTQRYSHLDGRTLRRAVNLVGVHALPPDNGMQTALHEVNSRPLNLLALPVGVQRKGPVRNRERPVPATNLPRVRQRTKPNTVRT